MKRHPAFQDLSRDHFVALNRSLQVTRAVEGHERAQPYEQAIYNFAALWTDDGLAAHFGEEEQDLVPLLRKGKADLADRMVHEHGHLRAEFDAIVGKTATPVRAAEAARFLVAHARWEEDVVFEWLQDNLTDAQLQELAARSRSYRTANGLPVGTPR